MATYLFAMSLDGIASQFAGADPQLQHFIEVETQKQRFQVRLLICDVVLSIHIEDFLSSGTRARTDGSVLGYLHGKTQLQT